MRENADYHPAADGPFYPQGMAEGRARRLLCGRVKQEIWGAAVPVNLFDAMGQFKAMPKLMNITYMAKLPGSPKRARRLLHTTNKELQLRPGLPDRAPGVLP